MPIAPRYRQGPMPPRTVPPPEPTDPNPWSSVRPRSPDSYSLPDNWPRNEMGFYEPWNNSRLDELRDFRNDWDNRPTREEQWERMNRTPRSNQMILNNQVSPSMEAAFRRAEILWTERQKRQGRPIYEILSESEAPRKYDTEPDMRWYTDMPDSWFDERKPGLPLTERTWESKEPAQLPPETGVDGYLVDPSSGDGPYTWRGPREEELFQYHWEKDWFFGMRRRGRKYIDLPNEQAEQDAEFRVRYQAYF